MTKTSLSLKQQLFCKEFVRTGNALQSYVAAYRPGVADMSPFHGRAHAIQKVPKVVAYLAELRTETIKLAAKDIAFGVAEVLQRWIDIATADPNEIVCVRIDCCRFCHGIDNFYQWTASELTAARNAALELKKPEPDSRGGIGYTSKRKPAANCPQCFGDGHEVVKVTDTKRLKGKAKLLYAGAKYGKYGIEVILHDQMAALNNIAKHLNMFIEKPKEKEKIPVHLSVNVTDPIEAAKIYKEIMMSD